MTGEAREPAGEPAIQRERADVVVVVDADRATQNHGTPPALLRCEFAATGYEQAGFTPMPGAGGYVATFRAVGARPEPGAIKACRVDG